MLWPVVLNAVEDLCATSRKPLPRTSPSSSPVMCVCVCLCAYAISHTTSAFSIVQPPSSCTQVISALRLSSLTFRQPLLRSRRPESSVSSARLKPKIFAELSIPQTRTQDARQHQNTSEKPRPPPTQQHNTPRQGVAWRRAALHPRNELGLLLRSAHLSLQSGQSSGTARGKTCAKCRQGSSRC